MYQNAVCLATLANYAICLHTSYNYTTEIPLRQLPITQGPK